MNASDQNYDEALVVWGVATVAFGFVARNAWFAFLALVAIPVSIALGYPDEYIGSEPAPIWWFGVMFGFFSGLMIAVEVLVRSVIEEGRALRRGAGRTGG